MEHKPIVIIDCFARNAALAHKLDSCIDRLKQRGLSTMLVTNTPVDREITQKLDLLLYDKENRLFDDTMPAKPIALMKLFDGMRVFEVVKGMQRHGLSVLRNLNMALATAQAYGYTHFHRVEVDDIMGDASLDFVCSVPGLVSSNGKRGLFMLNDNESESNISFHYMYCEIVLFKQSVARIETQRDYQDYLRDRMGTETFMNVEEFVRHNLNKSMHEMVTLNGSETWRWFPDTVWNTETSGSNLESKYSNCTTRMFRVVKEGSELDYNIVMTYNYGSEEKSRTIELIAGEQVVGTLWHNVKDAGWWQTTHIDKSVEAIRVIEDGIELYTEAVWQNYSGQYIELN